MAHEQDCTVHQNRCRRIRPGTCGLASDPEEGVKEEGFDPEEGVKEEGFDSVTKPKHYQVFADGTEAIDIIRASLTPQQFAGYCKGAALKYRLRAGKKGNAMQDIRKAEQYEKFLADTKYEIVQS